MITFIEYPRCSTCIRAKKWLTAQGIEFIDRHIVQDNPTAGEIALWHEKSGLPLKKFFNTSGKLYKDMQLKDKLPAMTQQEQMDLLATDGMLVKRPIVLGENFVLVGFKEDQWAEKLI